MNKKFCALIIVAVFVWMPIPSQAQDSGIKVIPIGETIKPEAGTGKKKKRRYRIPVVKEGTSFLVETMTALSSGLTQQGDTVYFVAAEDVGPANRPVISMGAKGRGRVTEVDSKGKTLTVQFETIETVVGGMTTISGEIKATGDKKKAAVVNVGEKFTATLQESLKAKRPPRKRTKKGEEEIMPQTGFVEISGKGVKADLAKGKASGKIKVVLEAPKGQTADDIETSSVVLFKVNNFELPQTVPANARTPKQGDANKNGVTDWTMYFPVWPFIKNQPKGSNMIYVKGRLKNGEEFEAVTRVKVDY